MSWILSNEFVTEYVTDLDYLTTISKFNLPKSVKRSIPAVPNLSLLEYPQAEKRKLTYPLVSSVDSSRVPQVGNHCSIHICINEVILSNDQFVAHCSLSCYHRNNGIMLTHSHNKLPWHLMYWTVVVLLTWKKVWKLLVLHLMMNWY